MFQKKLHTWTSLDDEFSLMKRGRSNTRKYFYSGCMVNFPRIYQGATSYRPSSLCSSLSDLFSENFLEKTVTCCTPKNFCRNWFISSKNEKLFRVVTVEKIGDFKFLPCLRRTHQKKFVVRTIVFLRCELPRKIISTEHMTPTKLQSRKIYCHIKLFLVEFLCIFLW